MIVKQKGAKTRGFSGLILMRQSLQSLYALVPKRVSAVTFLEVFGKWVDESKLTDTEILSYLIALYDQTEVGRRRHRASRNLGQSVHRHPVEVHRGNSEGSD